jgi:hypothetical protein
MKSISKACRTTRRRGITVARGMLFRTSTAEGEREGGEEAEGERNAPGMVIGGTGTVIGLAEYIANG